MRELPFSLVGDDRLDGPWAWLIKEHAIDHWYIAAFSQELGRGLYAVRESVVHVMARAGRGSHPRRI